MNEHSDFCDYCSRIAVLRRGEHKFCNFHYNLVSWVDYFYSEKPIETKVAESLPDVTVHPNGRVTVVWRQE